MPVVKAWQGGLVGIFVLALCDGVVGFAVTWDFDLFADCGRNGRLPVMF